MIPEKAAISAEARELAQAMQGQGIRLPLAAELPEYRRQLIEQASADVDTLIAEFDGDIAETEINGIRCRQITPANWIAERGPCVQYAFGGGYVSGSCFEDFSICLPLARLAAARILLVDYRLSPEFPYPLPQQDMQQVYPALMEEYGAARLVIAGESAGANQALSLLQQIRAQGLAQPGCAILLSPWCDLTNSGDSHDFNNGRDPSLNQAWVELAAALHADGHALDDPGISPLYGEMNDLPPCLITSGSCDLLLSQCLRLARKLRDAGIDCELRVWEGMWHVFEFYPIPEAESSIAEMAEFIRLHC